MTTPQPLSTDTRRAGPRACRFDDLPADVVDATKLRMLDVIGLALAGAETPFGRSTRDAAVAMSPPGPCRVFGSGEPRRRDDGGVRERRVLAGARVRRHAQRIDRAHEQPGGRGGARVVRDRAGVRPRSRSRPSPSATRSPAASAASRRDSFTSAASIRRDCSRRSASTYLAGRLLGLDAEADGARRRHLRQLRVRHSRMLGRRDADEIPASGMVGAERHHRRVSRARGHDRARRRCSKDAAACSPRTCRTPEAARDFGRVTDGLGTHWDSRNSSFKPFPAAHVIHPYIDALLRLRAAHAIAAGRYRADRLSGGGVHRADRLRADGREIRARVGLARPREPSVQPRGGVAFRRARARTRTRPKACAIRRFSRSPAVCVTTWIRIFRVRAASRAR